MILKKLYKSLMAASLVFFATIIPFNAFAASPNIEILWRLLAPAYFMLTVGDACLAEDPSFISRNLGKRGDYRAYAQEVKAEVSEGVPMPDLLVVLRRAADAAKSEALSEIRNLAADTPELEHQNIVNWCNTSATIIVRDFIKTHDEDHVGFEELLKIAKSS